MATQAPVVTSIEIVPVQPDAADRKILAFQRARTNRQLEDVAYVVKIFLAEELPPTGAGFALSLGETPIPRYSGFDGGIYFTVHDPRFFTEHAGATVRFEHDNGQIIETDTKFPETPTPEAIRFGLITTYVAAGAALPTKLQALTQTGSHVAPLNKPPSIQTPHPLRPTQKTILFIDDETFFAKYDIEALQDAGYEVTFHDTASGGLAYIQEHSSKIDLIILDIMMPTPKNVSAIETDDGNATGIWLLRNVRDLVEENLIPVIVLTNRSQPDMEESIAAQVGLPAGLVRVTTKVATSSKQLPGLISRMLNIWRKAALKPG